MSKNFIDGDYVAGSKHQQIGDYNKMVVGGEDSWFKTWMVPLILGLVVGLLLLAAEYFGFMNLVN